MNIKDFCIASGVSFGFSKVNYVTKNGTRLDYAITIMVRLSDAIIDEIDNSPTHTYFNHYRTINAYIDSITLRIGNMLQNEGYNYITVPASQSIPEDGGFSGILSHKKAAVLAGLGVIGKSALFISYKYGPRVRLGTILTDKPLDVNQIIYKDLCKDCNICVEKCPAMAIKGLNYNIGDEREAIFDANACSSYMKKAFKHIGRGAVCGICVKFCPYGINKNF